MSALYQQVCEQILARIQSGELAVGDRLPPEAKFAEDIGVSRSTVRLAFTELENAGVLLRRKKAGTQIIAEKPQQRFNMATSSVQELLSLGVDTTLEITNTRTVRTDDISELHGDGSETGFWLEISGTRTLPGEPNPFSVNQVYVPARYAGIEPLLSEDVTSVFQVIQSTFDVSVARVAQTVQAIACPAAQAKILGIKPCAPALIINAELFDREGLLMEVSVATFDPDKFQVQSDVQIL